ncbi:MAG: EAL domain-containing protein [Methylococcaceae bacterium]|nr:EAL domain-containing protein [Methylococcaceae bacterium]
MSDDWLSRQLILIGEPEESRATELVNQLTRRGVGAIRVFRRGGELAESLGSDSLSLSQASLIILNRNLPNVDWDSLHAAAVRSPDDGVNVPVIVYGDRPPGLRRSRRLNSWEGHGLSFLETPLNLNCLLPLIQLSLTLFQERCARRSQDAQLLEELAERRIMEARLKYLVAHDELTGLANRRSLEEHLQGLLTASPARPQGGALLYLDIDRFNIINDLEGHASGDRLLVEVVELLRSSLREEYLAARIGADEFCIFIDQINPALAVVIAEQLRRQLDGYRFAAGYDNYRISASIGVLPLASVCSEELHASEIISRAHQSCYVAKSHGRNRIHLYSDSDSDVSARRIDVTWAPMLREALADNRFFLVFQPVVRLADGAITHYEVLIRMRDRSGKVFYPGDFIPVAERMGLVILIDRWVLDSAIDFLCSLPDDRNDVCLTINLSGHSFGEAELPGIIQEKLGSTGIEPGRLTFEITETATVANHQRCREMIGRIRALGCHFALDDFGSGFSSFDYVKKFPVDYLKIDGQFIQNLVHDETDQVLVKAMIAIARKLEKKTIAEFVDDVRVLGMLQSLGVDFAQGYLLGRPEPCLLTSRSIPIHEMTRGLKKATFLN